MQNKYKITNLLLLLICLIFTTSCSDDENSTFEVKVNVSLDLTSVELHSSKQLEEEGLRRRFIIEAYKVNEPNPVIRKEIIFDHADISGEYFRLPVRLELPSAEYKLVVWTDYIARGSNKDLFYDTKQLSDVECILPNRGNNAACDASFGNLILDLKSHESCDKEIEVQIDLNRAVAPFKLIATDVQDFIKQKGDDAKGHAVTFFYGFYFPTGFDATQGTPNQSALGVTFSAPIHIDPTTSEEECLIGMDYIFAGKDESFITLDLFINDKDGGFINKHNALKIPYKQGYLTTLKANFLTSKPDSNINIDIEFEEDINLDLDNK